MNIRLLSLLAGAAIFPLPAMADTIKLKNGAVLDGNIVSETEAEIKIEVKQGGITNVVPVKKSEIAAGGVLKLTPDVRAAIELEKLLPTGDLLDGKAYEEIIRTKVKAWLDANKTSAKRADVEALLKKLEEEKAKADKGDRKLEGEWVSGEEIVWNSYNFKARIKRVKMEQTLAKGADGKPDPSGAYMLFAELEREYPLSTEFPKAIESMRAGFDSYETVLTKALADQPAEQKAKDEKIKSAPTAEKQRIIEAYAAETARFKASQAEDKVKKLAIPSWYKLDSKSISDALAALKKEKERMTKLDLAKIKTANEAFAGGLKGLSMNNIDGANVAVYRFEEANKFYANKSTELNERIREAKSLQKKFKDEQAAKTRATTPAAPTPAVAATPAAAPKKTEKTESSTASDDSESEPVRKAPPQEEESSNLPLYGGIGAGVALLAFLLAKVMGKKKSDD